MGKPTVVAQAVIDQLVRRNVLIVDVIKEVNRAYAKHGDEQWGRHEFYGVVKEEFDEMWNAIKLDMPQVELRKEIVHVMAMCLRYIETGDRYRERKKPGTHSQSKKER